MPTITIIKQLIQNLPRLPVENSMWGKLRFIFSMPAVTDEYNFREAILEKELDQELILLNHWINNTPERRLEKTFKDLAARRHIIIQDTLGDYNAPLSEHGNRLNQLYIDICHVLFPQTQTDFFALIAILCPFLEKMLIVDVKPLANKKKSDENFTLKEIDFSKANELGYTESKFNTILTSDSLFFDINILCDASKNDRMRVMRLLYTQYPQLFRKVQSFNAGFMQLTQCAKNTLFPISIKNALEKLQKGLALGGSNFNGWSSHNVESNPESLLALSAFREYLDVLPQNIVAELMTAGLEGILRQLESKHETNEINSAQCTDQSAAHVRAFIDELTINHNTLLNFTPSPNNEMFEKQSREIILLPKHDLSITDPLAYRPFPMSYIEKAQHSCSFNLDAEHMGKFLASLHPEYYINLSYKYVSHLTQDNLPLVLKQLTPDQIEAFLGSISSKLLISLCPDIDHFSRLTTSISTQNRPLVYKMLKETLSQFHLVREKKVGSEFTVAEIIKKVRLGLNEEEKKDMFETVHKPFLKERSDFHSGLLFQAMDFSWEEAQEITSDPLIINYVRFSNHWVFTLSGGHYI